MMVEPVSMRVLGDSAQDCAKENQSNYQCPCLFPSCTTNTTVQDICVGTESVCVCVCVRKGDSRAANECSTGIIRRVGTRCGSGHQ